MPGGTVEQGLPSGQAVARTLGTSGIDQRAPLLLGALGFGCCFLPMLVVRRKDSAAMLEQRQEPLTGGSA